VFLNLKEPKTEMESEIRITKRAATPCYEAGIGKSVYSNFKKNLKEKRESERGIPKPVDTPWREAGIGKPVFRIT